MALLNVVFVITLFVNNYVKVRDHCHITGKYKGSAYQDCNIKLKLNQKVPILFHNLKNYDAHQ